MKSLLAALLIAMPLVAQRRAASPNAEFIRTDALVIALTHVRVVDGTGAPARDDQTLVIENGKIGALGPSASTTVPAGAQSLDLRGYTLMPGLVGMHDH